MDHHTNYCIGLWLWAGLCMFLSHKKTANGGERVFLLFICLLFWPLYPISHLLDD